MTIALPFAALASCLAAGAPEARPATAAASTAASTAAAASPAADAPATSGKPVIVTRSPETRAKKVDSERLTVRRLDLVDEKGVIRMTLAAPTPEPIVDGIQYRRIFPASGMVIFDRDGNERGGYVVAELDGGTYVAASGDHVNGDAVAWRVNADGSVMFAMNNRAPVVQDASLGGRIRPAYGSTRIMLSVAADGAPAIALQDGKDRPRLRLTVTPEGYGAIEFLDADGKVVEVLAPEARRSR